MLLILYGKVGFINMIDCVIANIEDFIDYVGVKKLYLDVDGVLLHSCQAVCEMINEDMGTHYTGNQVISWNFKEICPDFTNEDIEKIFADERFFKYVNWIKGAKEFIKRHEQDITIITKGTWENICKKMDFFAKNKINVEFIGIPLSRSKSEIDMSDGIFIDDCTTNLNESNAKYKIQFCEYNDNLNDQREWIKGFCGYKLYKWA